MSAFVLAPSLTSKPIAKNTNTSFIHSLKPSPENRPLTAQGPCPRMLSEQYDEMNDWFQQSVTKAADRGVALLTGDDGYRGTGTTLHIGGRPLLNFTSNSYLALEQDPRVVEGISSAARAHGALTSGSRVYFTNPLCEQLEDLFGRIFGGPSIVLRTALSAHLSVLSALVSPQDALIMDQFVHNTVNVAVRYMKSYGTHVETVPHSRVDRLESRIRRLSQTHRKVWYLADGVYSMQGDIAPMRPLYDLLQRYDNFMLYVDDAHGMSWAGEHGRGAALALTGWHPRLIVSAALGKGFGSGGGVVSFGDVALRNRVRKCGTTIVFGGQPLPPVLGAGIASAHIHLSDELPGMQAQIRRNIDYANRKLACTDLAVMTEGQSPLGYILSGSVEATQRLSERLVNEENIFISNAQYPATPKNRGGIRFSVNRLHTTDQIDRLVAALQKHWGPTVQAAGEDENVLRRKAQESLVAARV